MIYKLTRKLAAFEIRSMRNAHLKTVRNLWKDSARIFFGRGAVMAKALGTTPEEEHRLGLSKLATQIKGQVAFDTEPHEVIVLDKSAVFGNWIILGNIASRTVTLLGPVLRHHSDPLEPFPHYEEPQLRKL